MATSAIAFQGLLTLNSNKTSGEYQVLFRPPSNLSGKICYIEAKLFTLSWDVIYTTPQAYHTFVLGSSWNQVQAASVEGTSSAPWKCDTTLGAGGTAGDTTVTVANAFGIAYGMTVTSSIAGIPSSTTVTGVSGTTITLSNALTANMANGSAITFYQLPYQMTQRNNAPLAMLTYQSMSSSGLPTLVYIPDGPHPVTFTVNRLDKGIIGDEFSDLSLGVLFTMVPANSRQPPIV